MFSPKITRRALLSSFALSLACARRVPAARGRASRVVSLSPSVTEVLFALGAGPSVVGVSRYDDWPPEALRLPRVGGSLDPSFEALVALRPDAVVSAQRPAQAELPARLEALGIRVLLLRIESLQELDAAIDRFAALVGREAQAPALRASITREVASARALAQGRTPPRTLVLVGASPLIAAGPGSFLDELLVLAGGRNVLTSPTRWPALSHESLLALAPEVILDLSSMDGAADRSPWRTDSAVPAVRAGRVHRLEDPVLLRPGPRIGRALGRLVRALYSL